MARERFAYENHKVKDNWTGEVHSSNMTSVNVLNAIHNENQRFRKELQKIYSIATANKAIEIVNEIYDDYLNKDPENEIYDAKREAILECLEKLDEFRDDLE